MLAACLVTVTEQEQPAASTLYTKNGGSMFFETSVTTYQNTSSQTPEKKNLTSDVNSTLQGSGDGTLRETNFFICTFIFLAFNGVRCFRSRQWFRL